MEHRYRSDASFEVLENSRGRTVKSNKQADRGLGAFVVVSKRGGTLLSMMRRSLSKYPERGGLLTHISSDKEK